MLLGAGAQQAGQIADFGMTIATVGDQERDQRAHAFDIGAVEDGAAIARAPDEAGAGQNAEMARERVVRAAHRLGDGAGRKPARPALHQQPENREPCRLAERRQRGQRMR